MRDEDDQLDQSQVSRPVEAQRQRDIGESQPEQEWLVGDTRIELVTPPV